MIRNPSKFWCESLEVTDKYILGIFGDVPHTNFLNFSLTVGVWKAASNFVTPHGSFKMWGGKELRLIIEKRQKVLRALKQFTKLKPALKVSSVHTDFADYNVGKIMEELEKFFPTFKGKGNQHLVAEIAGLIWEASKGLPESTKEALPITYHLDAKTLRSFIIAVENRLEAYLKNLEKWESSIPPWIHS